MITFNTLNYIEFCHLSQISLRLCNKLIAGPNYLQVRLKDHLIVYSYALEYTHIYKQAQDK